MGESLARVSLDISNRPFLSYTVPLDTSWSGSFDVGLLKEFFRAVTFNAGITAHIDLLRGAEPHHIAEAMFKAFARALDEATQSEPRLEGRVPSTKGVV
jgi:imidazoleglycerol-phosphate dehydratase